MANRPAGRFPVDAPKKQVVKALANLGFRVVREREHVSMVRQNPDGKRTPLTILNHAKIKGSTLRTLLSQTGISRDDFLAKYEET